MTTMTHSLKTSPVTCSTTGRLVGAALALSGLLAVAAPVAASQVTATFQTSGNLITGAGGGLFAWQRSSAPGAGNNFAGTLVGGMTDQEFVALCIEPLEHIGYGQKVTYEVVDLASGPNNNAGTLAGMGINKAQDLKRLFGGAYPTFGGKINDPLHGNTPTAANLDLAYALQIATWEIVYETNTTGTKSPGGFVYDVGAGFFTDPNHAATASQRTIANAWLHNLGTYTPAQGLRALTRQGTQDMVVQAVPIPAAAWLFGSALVGLAGVGRRKVTHG